MNENTLKAESGIGIGLWGQYKIQVVNPKTQEIVLDTGWNKNLILNTGMDGIGYSASLASVNASGIVGTGTRLNMITGSTSQITQSGAQLFLVDTSGLLAFTQSIGGYASAVSRGDVIIDSDGSRSYVMAVIDDWNVRVASSASFSTGKNFVIFKTSQTGLQTEVHRSNTYLVGSSSAVGWNCGTVVSESQVTMRRSYDFPVEVADYGYNEGGVSWSNTANAQVFARYLFPYEVIVSASYQLRMVHDFVSRYSPITERYVDPGITGWPTEPTSSTIGSESIQNFLYPSVNTNGAGGAYVLDPALFQISYGNNACIFISEDTQSLQPFGSALTRGTNYTYGNSLAATSPAYYPGVWTGTWTRVKAWTFGIYDSPNLYPALYNIGIGQRVESFPSVYYYPYQAGHQAFVFKFQYPQLKTNVQRLYVGFRFTWDRVIDH